MVALCSPVFSDGR